jgi:hypothetical protein
MGLLMVRGGLWTGVRSGLRPETARRRCLLNLRQRRWALDTVHRLILRGRLTETSPGPGWRSSENQPINGPKSHCPWRGSRERSRLVGHEAKPRPSSVHIPPRGPGVLPPRPGRRRCSNVASSGQEQDGGASGLAARRQQASAMSIASATTGVPATRNGIGLGQKQGAGSCRFCRASRRSSPASREWLRGLAPWR